MRPAIPPLALLLLTTTAAAQVAPGDTVRLRARDFAAGVTLGVIETIGPTQLTVRTAAGSAAIPLARIIELRRVTGVRTHLGRGLWLGALTGLAASELLYGGRSIDQAAQDRRNMAGVLAGLAVGGVVGQLRRTTRWEVSSLTTIRPEPLPGTRVRLRGHDGGSISAQGDLVMLTRDSVALETESGAVLRLGRDRIGAIESPWRSRRATRRGSLIGSGLGAVVGAVAGLAQEDESCSGSVSICFEKGAVVWFSAVLGAGFGAVLGAGVGSLSSVTDWERAVPDADGSRVAIRVAPVVTGRSLGLRGTIGF